MSSVEEVKATLAQADESADQARSGMAGVRDGIAEVRRLAGVTHDSRDPDVEAGHARLRAADAEVVRVIRLLGEAMELSERYRRSLG